MENKKKPTAKKPTRNVRDNSAPTPFDLTETKNWTVQTPQAPQPEERQSFIVQNIGSGYHCISDIGLEFSPGKAIDLTWWDTNVIKRSTDLRKALMSGQLIRIDEEDHIDLMREDIEISAAEARNDHMLAKKRQRKIAVGDREIEAEIDDLKRADGKARGGSSISTYGLDNDPQSYAKAFEIASADAQAQGRRITARSFKNSVEGYRMSNPNSPGLVAKLLESGGNSSYSGDPNRGRATVRVASDREGGAEVVKFNMTNFNRDHEMAGANEAGITVARHKDDLYLDELVDETDLEDVGEVDSIDLSMDDSVEGEDDFIEEEKAKIRRVGR